MTSTTNSSASPGAGWRRRLAARLEAPRVQGALIALILFNAAVLGLETSASVMARWGELLQRIDAAILAVFVVEIALRLVAHGARFFRDPWAVFDFIVVGIALLPASGPFAVLRALRVLRVLRLLTFVPSMRRVVGGLLAAIPGLSSVFAVILLIFYVGSVMATKLFGGQFPEWFGSIGASAYTLFQVMTLESWSMGIARPVMEAFPFAWAFFVPFILIATFTMLNLFIAVIVNAIQAEHAAEHDAEVKEIESVVSAHADERADALHAEIRALRGEVARLAALLEKR
ncbi:ion transporter [Burkholderiaceae bacterium FT117]|uniref:ion transporter n=1 Tax=Zeimonas sediminis TaxID=2944268 RepID=UPI0023431899|nr:ion transporter [Zeimonas sediminis]MCM5571528.1 ion transporter [Zeimonas sediminis]